MTKNGSKKPEIASKSILAPYEKVRFMTIERNAQKFRELGLDKIAHQLLEKNKKFSKGKENVNSNVDDQDYVPDEENCDLDEEFEMSREATTSIPKKKARTREQPPRKNKKQPLCPSMAMDDFLVAQNQMDPAEVRQIEQDVQQLEQDRQISKRPLSTIVPLESRGESVSAQVSKKKGRGPTNLFDVHARKWEDRVAIYCNDKGQAIGPEKARKELTRFLGTIAHDYNWAPLTYTNWKQVPNKEKIWEFVNSKYILPVEAKDWVMETLDQSWRGFKCRLKRDHYYMYDTYEERLKHPPERVLESHYKTLLAYWGTPIAKKISLQNSENRREQDNIHTNGPVSFAMKHEQLLRKHGVASSKRKMFEETRRRKEGRTYDLPYDDTQQKIQAMRELEANQDDQIGEYVKDPFDEVMGNARRGTKLLQGLGATRKKRKDKGPGTSLILPEEVMESIKSAVTADVQKDINAEIEEFVKEKEVHAAQVAAQEAEIERKTKELESETLKLQEIRMDIENQQGNITLDAVISTLAQLRQKDPSLTPEIIAKAIVSTTTN